MDNTTLIPGSIKSPLTRPQVDTLGTRLADSNTVLQMIPSSAASSADLPAFLGSWIGANF